MTPIRIIVLIAVTVGGLYAEPRYIGTASCAGSFWVDSAGVSSHATLFENSTIETEGSPARVQITGAVRIILDAHSRAQVDKNRLLLEKGRAQLDSGKDYRVEVRTMRVSLAKPQSRAVVSVDASGVVEVAAIGAVVHVANAEGVAVANVAAGRAVELRLGQTSEAAVLSGCVVKTGSAYTLRDEVSAVTVELRGADVASDVGRRVRVTGAMVPAQRALAPAEQVIQAKAIQVLAAGCGTATTESLAPTGSRARTAPLPDSSETAATGDASGGSSAGGASTGSTAGTGATASSAGAAGTASTAAAAGTTAAASAGIGVSTAVIAGVAVAAAAAGTTAAVVATQNNKPPISPGR